MYVQKGTIRPSYEWGSYTILAQTEVYAKLPLERMEGVAEGGRVFICSDRQAALYLECAGIQRATKWPIRLVKVRIQLFRYNKKA